MLPMVMATSELGVFQINSDVNFLQVCDNCTYVNLTSIKFPNSSIEIIDKTMTKSKSTYNYTFSKTESLGDYFYTTCGDPNGIFTCESVSFEITPSGFTGTLGFFILILALSAGVIIFGFSIKDAPVTILGSFGLTFLGLYILFNGFADIRDPIYTWAIGIIILMVASYIGIKSAYELIADSEY